MRDLFFNAVGYDFQNMWVKHHRFPKADILSISDLPTSDFHCWTSPVVSPYKTNKHTPHNTRSLYICGFILYTWPSLGLTSLGVPILRGKQIRVKKIKWEIIISFMNKCHKLNSFNAGVIPQFYTKFDLEWDYGTGLYIRKFRL